MIAGDTRDVLANIVLFIPLGFFYCIARSGRRWSAIQAVILGVVVSTAIEVAQLFESVRTATLTDVASNTLGAWIGGVAAQQVGRSEKIDGRLVGWLALELPLMGLVYLLVPLLWVNALASGGEMLRIVMALLLGVLGAVVLGGIQRHYLGPARASGPARTAVLAAFWFVTGALPSLAWRAFELLVGPAAVAMITWGYGRKAVPATTSSRRFEVPLLIRAAPLYGAYLALVIAAPLRHGFGEWHAAIGFPEITAQLDILRLLELVAAFTLGGYMLAEFGGRALSRYRHAIRRILLWSAALALTTEALRGYDPGSGASFAHGLLLIAAALYGGWLYYLQRAHVIRIVSENRAAA